MIPLIQKHHQALVDLCRKYHVAQLEVFGSAAQGYADAEARDLDFLVRFEAGGDMGPADQYFGLLEGLETLFGRPVDLVCAGALRNPYFIREIARSRNLLYAA